MQIPHLDYEGIVRKVRFCLSGSRPEVRQTQRFLDKALQHSGCRASHTAMSRQCPSGKLDSACCRWVRGSTPTQTSVQQRSAASQGAANCAVGCLGPRHEALSVIYAAVIPPASMVESFSINMFLSLSIPENAKLLGTTRACYHHTTH